MLLSLLLSCNRAARTVPTPEPACDLNLTALAGSEWLYLEARFDGTNQPTPRYRLRFGQGVGVGTLQYNAGSYSDMYTYTCTEEGSALSCQTPAEPEAWCRALLAAGERCEPEKLRIEEPGLTDEAIAAATAAAQEAFAQLQGTEQEARFRMMNNNLGNKLRLQVEITVDEARCRLVVTDLYKTLYSGRWYTDSNPAGTNPFVASAAGELLWESCPDTRSLVAVREADDTVHQKEHTVETPIHLRYLPPEPSPADTDCSHRYTLWHNAQPAERGEAVVRDGAVDWRTIWTPTAPSAAYQAEVFHFQAQTTCGEVSREAMACAAVRIQ